MNESMPNPINSVEVFSSFRIANPDQAEFMLDGERYLTTKRDETYEKYAEVMANANLPYLEDSELSDEYTVVGKIPVGGRTLPQVMRSYQDPYRTNSVMAMHLVGQSVKKLITAPPFLLPNADDFSINRCLIDYREGYVLLPPPMRFVNATQHAAASLEVVVGEQLESFTKFGGEVVLKSFIAGMRDL